MHCSMSPWTPFVLWTLQGMPTLCPVNLLGTKGRKLGWESIWGVEGRRRGQLSSALSKEQEIPGPSRSGFSRKAKRGRGGSSWTGSCSLHQGFGGWLQGDLGTDCKENWGTGPAASLRDLGTLQGEFSTAETGPAAAQSQVSSTLLFRSPPLPAIPWLLHQLWDSTGAAPVPPAPCENLGVFWEKRGHYLGRTVASLLNLAPQLFPGVNMEIRVNKTHGGKMYDSNLH